MVKILSIGNSFSEDAMAYLHDMAECGGNPIESVNLYIAKCSLKIHWENAEGDLAAYDYQLNGRGTGRKISIKNALLEGGWDYVTMQQASYDCGMEQTYYPYITQLSQYIKKYKPDAKQLVHQTWAYEIDSAHPGFQRYGNDQQAMYRALRKANKNVSESIHAEMIPSGDVIQALRGLKEFDYAHGGQSLCRDGHHMDLLYGRYAIAATWYESVLKGNILQNRYIPPGAGSADQGLIKIIAQTVHRICST